MFIQLSPFYCFFLVPSASAHTTSCTNACAPPPLNSAQSTIILSQNLIFLQLKPHLLRNMPHQSEKLPSSFLSNLFTAQKSSLLYFTSHHKESPHLFQKPSNFLLGLEEHGAYTVDLKQPCRSLCSMLPLYCCLHVLQDLMTTCGFQVYHRLQGLGYSQWLPLILHFVVNWPQYTIVVVLIAPKDQLLPSKTNIYLRTLTASLFYILVIGRHLEGNSLFPGN